MSLRTSSSIALFAELSQKQNIVLWYSQYVTISNITNRAKRNHTTTSPGAGSSGEPSVAGEAKTHSDRVARQTLRQSCNKHCVLVKSTTSGYSTFKLRIMKGIHQMTSVAHNMITIFHYNYSIFFYLTFLQNTGHLSKHMAVAYSIEPPTSVMTASTTPLQRYLERTRKRLDRFADSSTTHGQAEHAEQTITDSPHTIVAAVHYKTKLSRAFPNQ